MTNGVALQKQVICTLAKDKETNVTALKLAFLLLEWWRVLAMLLQIIERVWLRRSRKARNFPIQPKATDFCATQPLQRSTTLTS